MASIGLGFRAKKGGSVVVGISVVDREPRSIVSTFLDELSLTQALGLPDDQIERHLKAFGAAAGRPWRKEQKLAALAAWLSLVDERTTLVE